MPDTKQSFWDEFKAMFADPENRKALVNYFDQLMAEIEGERKQAMKIAVVGDEFSFQAFTEYIQNRFGGEELYPGYFALGKIGFQMVRGELEAYGVKFDAFINRASDNNELALNAASYLAGHNTKSLTQRELYLWIQAHSPNES